MKVKCWCLYVSDTSTSLKETTLESISETYRFDAIGTTVNKNDKVCTKNKKRNETIKEYLAASNISCGWRLVIFTTSKLLFRNCFTFTDASIVTAFQTTYKIKLVISYFSVTIVKLLVKA